MKKLFLFLTIALAALTACKKDNKELEDMLPKEVKTADVNSTSFKDWHYFSFATGKVVGSAPDPKGEAINKEWAARKDWDVAFQRSSIRTNSGEATSAGAKGGVFVMDAATKFDDVKKLPANAVFESDKAVTGQGMSGPFTTIMSKAKVAKIKGGHATSGRVEYLPQPMCVFKNAAGDKSYKVSFESYVNDEGKGGHIKIKYAEL